MQSARALVATFGQNPRARGHGLAQLSSEVPEDVMNFEVAVRGNRSLFHEVCDLTSSDVPTAPLALCDLFLSLPELAEIPSTLHGARAIYVERVPDPTEFEAIPDPFVRILLETESLPDNLPELYPTLHGWHEESSMQRSITSRRQSARVFRSNEPIQYIDRLPALEAVAPTHRYFEQRWVRPVVGGVTRPLSPLASWYALLNGFSILARYEPSVWVDALQPRSQHAAAIDGALEEALVALPEFLWKEISVLQLSKRQEESGDDALEE